MLTLSLSLFRTLIWLTVTFAVAGQAYAGPYTGQNAAQYEALDLNQVQRKGLTVDQAKTVLVMVLRHEKLMMDEPGFNIEHTNNFVSGYASFFVTFDSPTAGATNVIGSFVVSPLTGDVWETNLCRRYAFQTLKKTQAAIMQRTGKTVASEVNARRHLGCTDE